MDSTTYDGNTIIVGYEGLVLTAKTGSNEWSRFQVEGKPSFIDVAACGSKVAALTMGGEIWVSDGKSNNWTGQKIGTVEVPQALTCDQKEVLWTVGSFSTIYSSEDSGKTWVNHSLEDDIILSTIQFLDDKKGIITGEFGTVLFTEDGGETWDFGESIPKEFFPLASTFKDAQRGWVVGLNGIIYFTEDGGSNWNQQPTDTVAPLFAIQVIEDQLVAVGDDGSIIHNDVDSSQNQNWKVLNTETKSRSFFRVIEEINQEQIIVAGANGSLMTVDLEN
ncbi:MAG: WD40/YVTN/BNR-like repeat-containing protein [Gammaproteobacteria bacterium]